MKERERDRERERQRETDRWTDRQKISSGRERRRLGKKITGKIIYI